jgi:hypothetical protein
MPSNTAIHPCRRHDLPAYAINLLRPGDSQRCRRTSGIALRYLIRSRSVGAEALSCKEREPLRRPQPMFAASARHQGCLRVVRSGRLCGSCNQGCDAHTASWLDSEDRTPARTQVCRIFKLPSARHSVPDFDSTRALEDDSQAELFADCKLLSRLIMDHLQ